MPDSVATSGDYVLLLTRMLAFHRAADTSLRDPRWARSWTEIGIELVAHERAGLIERDLLDLRAAPQSVTTPPLELESFAEALGCLYVVEGSSLGGQLIAPSIVRVLGSVPTAYYSGTGRQHPAPWRSLQAALSKYSELHSDHDGVVDGAIKTFTFFGHLSQIPKALHESV